MLENIKAYYFYPIIFSFIDEKRKLELIKYNKSIQNKIDIDIIYYIRFSKKYIKYETKNMGKEYNFENDELIYEGEYLNGRRNGKGKEYENGKLRFEGEYLNGKRNGKGKEYLLGDKLLFEGEYINGNKNKKGKEYFGNGKLRFDGEYLNGKKWNGKTYVYNNKEYEEYEVKNGNGYIQDYNKSTNALEFEGEIFNGERNGKGKEYDDNERLIFEGEYLNGERNGQGREYNEAKHLKFEGEYLNGKRWTGKGYQGNNVIYELNKGKGFVKDSFFWGNNKFEGEYLNGERNGKGKEIHPHIFGAYIFEGEYLNGERSGKGKEYNGPLLYDGEYLKGKRHGKGKLYKICSDKLEYDGAFYQGYKSKGKEYIKDILIYEGIYILDKKWEGKGFDKNGNIIYELKKGSGLIKEFDNELRLKYEGEYKNGRRNGKGKEYFEDILIFEGEFYNGERWNGIGKYWQKIGDKLFITFDGEYKNGKKNGKGKEYYEDTLIFEGEFFNGEKWNGKGKKYKNNGELIFYEYIDGKRKE